MGSARINAIRQRLSATGLPDDFGKKRKGPKDKKFDKLVDDITDIVMKERRQNLNDSSKHGRPEGMRKDLSTPLIKEVPFGPEKYPLGAPDFGDPEAYEHIDHRPFTDLTFEEAEAKAKEMGLPEFEEQIGIPKELRDKSKAFHIIPHGGISIPKEQKRKQLPIEKRNWDKNKRLITRGNMQDKRRQDAEEIALDIMNDEKPSRLVNRRTKKIRPPKPVRSDFAEIITAKQRIALEGGRHGNRKYWLYKDGTISKESGCHNQIHPTDIGEMESGSVKITHEIDRIGDKYFHIDLRTHLTPKQRNHIRKQIVENK